MLLGLHTQILQLAIYMFKLNLDKKITIKMPFQTAAILDKLHTIVPMK